MQPSDDWWIHFYDPDDPGPDDEKGLVQALVPLEPWQRAVVAEQLLHEIAQAEVEGSVLAQAASSGERWALVTTILHALGYRFAVVLAIDGEFRSVRILAVGVEEA